MPATPEDTKAPDDDEAVVMPTMCIDLESVERGRTGWWLFSYRDMRDEGARIAVDAFVDGWRRYRAQMGDSVAVRAGKTIGTHRRLRDVAPRVIREAIIPPR